VGALVVLVALTKPATADELGRIFLFEQEYVLQRFDYNAHISFPDRRTPGRTCQLWGVSGATFDQERGVLILTSNTQQNVAPYSYKNYVIEAEVNLGPTGLVTGFTHTRTLVAGDTSTMGYDLEPRGVTINTSDQGLGAGGNLVVSTSNNWLRAFDIDTGSPIIWGPSTENGFPINVPNTSTEDAAYIPGANSFFTIWRAPVSACTIFNRFGRTGPAFYVARSRDQSMAGLPVSISCLEPWAQFPRLFEFQTTILVGTDSANPAIEAYDVRSRFIARERLSSTPTSGAKTFPLHGSNSQLWISAIANDRNTGRLFVFNRGNALGTTDVFVLTPLPIPCFADFNLDGFLDFFDYDDFGWAYETGDMRADFNRDGFLDFFDYDGFKEVYEAGC
jgi:hypothetical protein